MTPLFFYPRVNEPTYDSWDEAPSIVYSDLLFSIQILYFWASPWVLTEIQDDTSSLMADPGVAHRQSKCQGLLN